MAKNFGQEFNPFDAEETNPGQAPANQRTTEKTYEHTGFYTADAGQPLRA